MTQRAIIARLVGLYLRQFEDRHLHLSIEDYARIKAVLSHIIDEIPPLEKRELQDETVKAIGHKLVAITAKDEDQQSLHGDYFEVAKDQLEIKKEKIPPSPWLWSIVTILLLGILGYIVTVQPIDKTMVDTVYQVNQKRNFNVIEVDTFRTIPIELDFSQFQDSVFFFNNGKFVPGDTISSEMGDWILSKNEVRMLNYIPEISRIDFDTTFSINLKITSSVLDYSKSSSNVISAFNKEIGIKVDTLYTRFQFNYIATIPITITKASIKIDTLKYPGIDFQEYPYKGNSIGSLEEKVESIIVSIRRWFYFWRILIGLIVWVGVFVWLYYKWRQRNQVVAESESIDGPFFYHLRIPERPKVRISSETSQNLDHLRKMSHKGRYKVNMLKTIDSVIHNGGFLEDFIYDKKGMKVHYLFLIHKRSRTDHRAQFWNEILEGLSKKDIACDQYYYDDRAEIYFKSSSDHTRNIKQLKNDFPESVVVLIGNNHQLINENGQLSYLAQFFNQWDSRFVLTHRNYYAWSYQEKVLKEIFHLFPAQLDALKYLDFIPNGDDEIKYSAQFEDHMIRFENVIDYNGIKTSFNAVQRDWIAACALYPDLHYDISLELGRVVYAERGAEFDCREVEKVFSMPWFAKGYFPSGMRKELINSLDEALKTKLRKMIASPIGVHEPPPDSYANYRYKSGQLTNALHAAEEKDEKNDIQSKLKTYQEMGIPVDLPNKDTGESKWVQITSGSKEFLNTDPIVISCWIACYFLFFLLLFGGRPGQGNWVAVSQLSSTLESKLWSGPLESDSLITHRLIGFEDSTGIKVPKNDDIEAIWQEYLYRKDIRSQRRSIHDLPNMAESLEYHESSISNLTVDFFNLLIKEGKQFDSTTKYDFVKDDDLLKNGFTFCQRIDSLDQFIRINTDSNLRFGFIDSLDLMNEWCARLSEINLSTDGAETVNPDDINCLNGGEYMNGQCNCPSNYGGNDCGLGPITIGLHSFLTDENKVSNVLEEIQGSNFDLIYHQDHTSKAEFLGNWNTLFYYDDRLASHAKEFAENLSASTNTFIDVQKGAGNITRQETLPFTYRIHLVQSNEIFCERLFLPLIQNLSKSSGIYTDYIKSGKTFKFAEELYSINKIMLELLKDTRNNFTDLYSSERKELENHFNAWINGYESQVNGKKLFKDDDIFNLVYEGPTFPNDAATRLGDFYMSVCGALDSKKFGEYSIGGINDTRIETVKPVDPNPEKLTKLNIINGEGYAVENALVNITNPKGEAFELFDLNALSLELGTTIDIDAMGYFPQNLVINSQSQLSDSELNLTLKEVSRKQRMKYNAFLLGYSLYQSIYNSEDRAREIIRLREYFDLEGVFNEGEFRKLFDYEEGELSNIKVLHTYYNRMESIKDDQVLNAFKLGLEGSFCENNTDSNQRKNTSKSKLANNSDKTRKCDLSGWYDRCIFNERLIGLPDNFRNKYKGDTLFSILSRIN